MEIAFFAVIAVVILLIAGGAFSEKAIGIGAVAMFFGCLFMFFTLMATFDLYGTLRLRNLDGKTFVVEAKVNDSSGEEVFLLYDLKEKENRVAKLDIYPPQGYKETTTTDGTILLTPIPGK